MTFLEILDHLGISHHPGRENWENLAECPFCRRPYMGYSKLRNIVTCWKCGWHPIGDTLIEASGRSWTIIRELLGKLDRQNFEPISEKPIGRLELPKRLGPLLPGHKRYLRERGFSISPLERLWGIQGIGIAHALQWRIFIPITLHGKAVSWTTRSISDDGVRYISASPVQESIPHKTLLYGEDLARHAILITEGPTDTWRLGPGAVGVLGIQYSTAQILRMSKYPRRVVVFDSDDGAQKRADQLCTDLSMFPGETFNVRLDSKDAGSATKKEILKIRKFLD